MANTAAKKITYDGKPVQVESAIRDGSGKEISSTYAPKFTVETTGSGNAVTAVSYASNKITATKGTTFSTSDTKNTAGSTESASKLYLIGATSQAANPQTYSSSKVYETDGALVATTIDATQVGGTTKTYTTGANTTRVILARVNNYTGLASCRIKLEIGPDTSSGAKVAYLDAVWAGRGARLVIESVYDWNNAVRYFFITCPNNTSYYTSYPPEIHIQQNSAVARTIKATIIEKSGDVVLLDNLTTAGVTTNRNSYTYDVNNTVGLFDNAGYINTSGWSNGTWDRVDNDRYRISATKVFVNGSTNRGVRGGKLSGMGSDGYLYHVATPEMTFQLPFVGGRTTGDFDINSTWGRVSYAIRGLGTAEFTNLLICNTAALTAGATYTGTGTCYATQYRFNVPGETEVTTLTAGKNVYVIGNLDSNGNFKPYYTTQMGQTIAVPKGQGGFTANTNCVMYKYTFYLTQTPVYNANYNTFLFIGRSDQSTTQFSYLTYNPIAYTLNSNNKLTHIDGKQIFDSGNSGGTVTQVKVGTTAYNPSSGIISLPAYPTVSYPVTSVNSKTGAVSLTASDVSALASTTKYAGSGSVGGGATKLNINDVSSTSPQYLLMSTGTGDQSIYRAKFATVTVTQPTQNQLWYTVSNMTVTRATYADSADYAEEADYATSAGSASGNKSDGVTGATVNRYANCTTAAATAAKTATITTGTFTLETGARVTVRFANQNTALSPTLNINSTGAKNIFHNGAKIGAGNNRSLLYGACDFVYDGTQWLLIGNYVNTNNSVTQTYTTTDASYPVLMSYLSIASGATSVTSSTNCSTGVYANPSTGTLYANSPAPATGGLRKITASTSAPTASDGADGDVWIQYTA